MSTGTDTRRKCVRIEVLFRKFGGERERWIGTTLFFHAAERIKDGLTYCAVSILDFFRLTDHVIVDISRILTQSVRDGRRIEIERIIAIGSRIASRISLGR